MSYFKTVTEAREKAHYNPSSLCAGCGQDLQGPIVAYDICIAKNTCQTSLMHREISLKK
jgi:hypothetical protein